MSRRPQTYHDDRGKTSGGCGSCLVFIIMGFWFLYNLYLLCFGLFVHQSHKERLWHVLIESTIGFILVGLLLRWSADRKSARRYGNINDGLSTRLRDRFSRNKYSNHDDW